MVYYAEIQENVITGYYTKEIHEYIPKNSIPVNEELWQHLLSHNKTIVNLEKLSEMPITSETESALTIEYKDIFSINEEYFSEKKYNSKRINELNELDELKNKVQELEALISNLTQNK